MKILYLLVFMSAVASVYTQLNHMNDLFMVLKPLTTILIIIAVVVFGSRKSKRFFGLMLTGLIACLLGDALLLKDAYFVYGLGAFLLGHLLFVFAFVALGGFKTYPLPLVVLASFGLLFYLYLMPSLGTFSVPVAVYISVIVLMAWQGVSLAKWRATPVTKCIGLAAILFMISDSVIAINKFLLPFDASSAVVLPTYWLSIGLLSYSVILFKNDAASIP